MIAWARKRDTRLFYQIIRYGVVGVSATIIDLLIFAALSQWVLPAIDTDLGDSVRASRSMVNSTVAFFVANLYTYFINKHYVFVPGRHRPLAEFVIFVGVSTISLLLGLGTIWILIHVYSMGSYTAKGVAIAASILINYVCRRYLVFKT